MWKRKRLRKFCAEGLSFDLCKKGNRKGEDVYLALGQTTAGRYISVLFVYKLTKEALIMSARDMARKERRQYERK